MTKVWPWQVFILILCHQDRIVLRCHYEGKPIILKPGEKLPPLLKSEDLYGVTEYYGGYTLSDIRHWNEEMTLSDEEKIHLKFPFNIFVRFAKKY